MSKSELKEPKEPKEPTFTRETIISSGHFKKCNRFFLSAILKKPEYTLREAEEAVKKFMERKIKTTKESE